VLWSGWSADLSLLSAEPMVVRPKAAYDLLVRPIP
jgi:hypothetical protein